MRFYSNNATSEYRVQCVNMRFLCTGVVGLKLAMPSQTEEYLGYPAQSQAEKGIFVLGHVTLLGTYYYLRRVVT